MLDGRNGPRSQVVQRRAVEFGVELDEKTIETKAEGVAYAMRNALDYCSALPNERLNKRVLSLYYGAIAFAFAEMLANPNGPVDLDEVEGMTKQGHGPYTVQGLNGSFSDLNVGVIATGFLPRWISTLGYDTSDYPKRKARNAGAVAALPKGMAVRLEDLFASMPEISDLYIEVFDGAPKWLVPTAAIFDNGSSSIFAPKPESKSTCANFIDYSGKITAEELDAAGLPLAEVSVVKPEHGSSEGSTFRARVDHIGHDTWWNVIPMHTSPFTHRNTVLLPTMCGLRDYRVIATTILYAMSIMVRYMPSAWRRIEGGDEDQFLAVVQASLAAWERVLPEQFLESIAGEKVHSAQPGSFGI